MVCTYVFFYLLRHVLNDGSVRDRRKLTFYFIADKRIDFRELVRELFRCVSFFLYHYIEIRLILSRSLYKTRIWMASLQGGAVME